MCSLGLSSGVVSTLAQTQLWDLSQTGKLTVIFILCLLFKHSLMYTMGYRLALYHMVKDNLEFLSLLLPVLGLWVHATVLCRGLTLGLHAH